MIKDIILKKLCGSPGRKPRLPRKPRLTVWEPLVYTVYNNYILYYILLVKDLPRHPGVAARMGFEPTTFRSKSIESTNVPPRPKNFNCKKLLNDSVRLQHSRCFMNSASS